MVLRLQYRNTITPEYRKTSKKLIVSFVNQSKGIGRILPPDTFTFWRGFYIPAFPGLTITEIICKIHLSE